MSWILSIFLLIAAPGVSGVVRDSSGAAVPNAVVIARPVAAGAAEQQTITGADGRFSLPAAAEGEVMLIVRAGGFAEQSRRVDASATGDVEVVLEPAPLLETVTVTASKREERVGDVPASVNILTSEEIKQSPAVVADDVLRQIPTFSLFRRTSSLSSHPTSQGVSLRGIGPSGVSRTLVLVDGVPVNDPFGGWVYWTRVPLESVDRVELVEGSSSSLYGNYAEGGVVSIFTARPSRRTLEIKPQYGNHNSPKLDFFGSDVWGKVGLSVDGSTFNTDGFPIVAENERGVIDIPATVKFTNVNAKVDYSPTDRMLASFRAGYFTENRGNGKILEVNDTRWTSYSGTLRVRMPDESDLQAAVFGDHENFHSTFLAVSAVNNVPRSAVRLTLDQRVPTNGAGTMVQWTKTLRASNVLSVGTDWRWVDGDSNEDAYNQVGPLISPVTASVLALKRVSGGTQQSVGAYVQDVFTPIANLSITLAGRLDYWHSYDAHNLETNVPAGTPGAGNQPSLPDKSATVGNPRAAALYRFSDRVSVWGSVGKGFRAPTLNELYRQFRVGTTLTLANFDLNPERLTGTEGGVTFMVSRDLLVRATAFANSVNDPVFNMTIAIQGANITQQRQNVPRTQVNGFQTDVEYRYRDWRFAGAYMYNDATVKEVLPPPAPNIPSILGNDLQQVPHNRGSFQIGYSNPSIATVAFNVLASGDQFDDDLNTPSRILPNYAVADLMASRTIVKNVDAYFGMQNIFNKTYVVATLPTTTGTPRLVNVGVRFRFNGR